MEKQRADGTWETRRHELREYLKQNSDERDVLITDECFEIVEKSRQLQEQKEVFYDGYLFRSITPSDLGNKIRRLCVELNLYEIIKYLHENSAQPRALPHYEVF